DLNPFFGFNDIDGNDVWTWISGESVTYTNWAPGEPNWPWAHHYWGNLFPINHAYAGKWNNTTWSDVLNGIAEISMSAQGVHFGFSQPAPGGGVGSLYANIVDTNNTAHVMWSPPGLIYPGIY